MDTDIPTPPDEELPPDEESEPDWKVYEGAVAHIEESYHDCAVARNYNLEGQDSSDVRQVGAHRFFAYDRGDPAGSAFFRY